ncbi:MAG: efflux RND transporter permease subunit [Deltaproteobacteria bacterium]|nr:efflux RND transporter permease subunit [Deltaproteobacteria bacterium]
MIVASVRNPWSVMVASLFVTLAGVMAARLLPSQLRPTVEPPEIVVTTAYPGAAPAEVEDQVTRRIEEQIRSVNGLREMLSSSSLSRSEITLRFTEGIDRDAAMIDVLNKMAGVRGLPPEADPPEVVATSSDSQSPMIWLGLREPEGQPPTEQRLLRDLADEVISPRIRRVDGVAGLIVSGGAEREMHVRTDFDVLSRLQLSVRDILAALTRDNANARGGPLTAGKREYAVRTTARAESAEELESIVIRRDESGTIRVGDVAEVVAEPGLQPSIMRLTGVPGVALGVQRRTGANVPSTTRGVLEAVNELHAQFEAQGFPARMRVLYSEQDYIDEALAGALGNIAGGALLSLGVLWWVLRSWRAVGVVALAQPLAVLGVFPVLWALGRSLNIITLAGLAFAVGITIDNAIVVVENVYRLRQAGRPPVDAALEGTREVAGAMLAATLTNVCVFAPVIFLGGEAGQIFRDLALSISVACALSLLAVLTVVPALAARGIGTVREDAGPGGFARAYGRVIDAVTSRRPWARLAVIGGALSLSCAGVFLVPDASYLPEGNRNLILTVARPLPGTSPAAAAELLRPIEEELVDDPRIGRTFVVFNTRFSAMGLTLLPPHSAPGPFAEFLGELRGRTARIPGFRFLFPRRASIFNDPGRQFEVRVVGPDLGELVKTAGQIQAKLASIDGIVSVRSNYEAGTPEIHVEPDRRRLAELGLRPADLAVAVEAAVGGRRVGTFLDAGEEIDLVVLGPDAYREDPRALASVPVAPGVRLDAVARVVEGSGPVAIPHFDQQRAVTLSVNVGEGLPLGHAIEQAQAEVFAPFRASLPPGYAILLGGTADRLDETLDGLAHSFGWAVLIVYLLLVALYRSWGAPVVILTAVPLAVCGALLALAAVNVVSRVEFDTIAMLGLVLLCGVIVNTSILIVSQAQNFVDHGMSPADALRESSVTRLRPILMSAITSVVGMLPLAAGTGSGTELYRGLGVVMVGGLLLGTVMVPLVVPATLALSPRWRRRDG